MSTLQALADARAEILKAEVAALLHNIGKLDVNFLLAQMGQEAARREIQEQLCDIPAYYFDRFAAPDLGLLAKGGEALSREWRPERRQGTTRLGGRLVRLLLCPRLLPIWRGDAAGVRWPPAFQSSFFGSFLSGSGQRRFWAWIYRRGG